MQALLMLAGDEAAAAPCRILLADDSIDNRLLIRAYLGKTGYGLDEAENGQVAVDKLVSGRYDLVLMDIQMPVMDGFTAVRRVRQWERENNSPRTPIIALTASTFDETVRKAIEAGCDSHLGKPLRRSTLLRVIRESALSERPDKPASAAA
jgi:CheY-like chemotaxis protein